MFSFEDPIPIKIRDIKNRLSDEAIYSMYCRNFTTKAKIRSPFRNDRDPSFHFFEGSSGIMWKDHGSGESGGAILFVKNCLVKEGKSSVTLQETLQHISDTFGLGLGKGLKETITFKDKQFSEKKKKPKAVIEVTRKPFSDIEKEYWNQFNITIPYLKMYHVGSAKEVRLNGNVSHITSDTSPVFFYYFPITNSYKIYRPYAITEKKKWLSNTSSEKDIQGLTQCRLKKRKTPLMIMTKAMKEVIFYRTFGIDAIAIQGENHYYNRSFMEFLKSRCDNIITFYDRDKAGVKGSLVLRRDYQIPGIFINKKHKAKNITDLWLINPKAAMEILKQLKQKYGI
jgi:hypothetical protein